MPELLSILQPGPGRMIAMVLSRPSLAVAIWVFWGPLFCVAVEPGHQVSRLAVPSSNRIGFQAIPSAATGIDFTNVLDLHRGLVNQNLMNGSGVAAGDVDGDGRCDLYFCGLDVENRLYRNLGGFRFEDITRTSGTGCPNQDSTGAVLVDIDADGDLDLFVSALGPGVRLFLNDGHGQFNESTDAAGLRRSAGSTSMALADVDGDGDLDLYVTAIPRRPVRNEMSTTYQVRQVNGMAQVVSINGKPTTSPELTGRFKVSSNGEIIEYGEEDQFYLNNGNGTFTRSSFTDGRFLDEDGKPLASPPLDWGLAVHFHDLNGDRQPDLYVCNDLFTPDRIWINQGHGVFKALAQLAVRHTSLASMGMDAADVNRDGYYDLFVSDMFSRDRKLRMTQFAHVPPKMWEDGVIGERLQFNHNALLLNRGDLTFAEISFYSGVAASDWSWGGVFLDVDLDGYEDLLIPNGQQRNLAHADYAARLQTLQRGRERLTLEGMVKLAEEFPPLTVPNMAFRNRRDLTFEEIGVKWGFATATASQGLALADLDNDGDLDVIVNNLLAPAGLFRNESDAPRLAVRLRGAGQNRAGIGAQIKVTDGTLAQQQEMICGGRYLSGDDALRVFATGQAHQVDVEVIWRNGKHSVIRGAKPNSLYLVAETEAEDAPSSAPVVAESPMFEDVSGSLPHVHVEQPFNDLAWQPLLPYRLTRSGPGLSWFDLDGDGMDDLLIPGGQGGALGIYLNSKQGFRALARGTATDQLQSDQTAVIGWMPNPGAAFLVVAWSNYKPSPNSFPAISFFNAATGKNSGSIGPLDGPVGPMAMADLDGDGDLDLFVGTTSRLGRFPEPGSGYLFRNDEGKMVLAQQWNQLGVIQAATFSDLDLDGFPELILACTWGPIRIFSNRQGNLVESTAQWGLLELTGLWQGLTTGDFDGDGRLDLAASNWGLNSALQDSERIRKRFYYGDLDGDGRVELIDVAIDPVNGKQFPAANLNLLAGAVPAVRGRIRDYESYSSITVQELFGEHFARLSKLDLSSLASTVFLNRGDRFEIRALPPEAQFAPAFGLSVADFDGDGNEDLFLSQNAFVMGMSLSRQDAGRGLWLRGDGKGDFKAVPGQSSGLLIYGEQRGCAASDFDLDGRVDIAVAQNNGKTKLFRNRHGIPGRRIHLHGPAGNRGAIGAVLRTGRAGTWSSAKEIRSGTGYRSSDSAIQVFAHPESWDEVEVQWPGGKRVAYPVLPGKDEIQIDILNP